LSVAGVGAAAFLVHSAYGFVSIRKSERRYLDRLSVAPTLGFRDGCGMPGAILALRF
jgi:hypothetical protein